MSSARRRSKRMRIYRQRVLALGASLGALLLASSTAFAAPTAQEAAGESNLGFLFAGFAVVWVGIIAYAFYIGRRERTLRQEIDELRRQLAEKSGSSQP